MPTRAQMIRATVFEWAIIPAELWIRLCGLLLGVRIEPFQAEYEED